MTNWLAVVGAERETIEVTRGAAPFGPHDTFRQAMPGHLWLILEDGSHHRWDDQDPIPNYVEVPGMKDNG